MLYNDMLCEANGSNNNTALTHTLLSFKVKEVVADQLLYTSQNRHGNWQRIIPKILTAGHRINVDGCLLAQTSIFKWILSQPVVEKISQFCTHVVKTSSLPLGELLKKFWEEEKVPATPTQTGGGDRLCEKLYEITPYLREDDRYEVK